MNIKSIKRAFGYTIVGIIISPIIVISLPFTLRNLFKTNGKTSEQQENSL